MLILMLAIGFSLGVVISQVPQDLAYDPTAFANWVEVEARPRYGVFTNLLFLFGLLDVFHAVWFRSLLILLFVAIVVCTLNRFPAIYQSTVKAKPVVSEGYMRNSRHHAEFQLQGSIEDLKRELSRQRYSLTEREEGSKTHLYADKYGWAKYATFVSHLGLLVFLFGGLMTNTAGYQRFLVIPDEQTQPLYPVYHPEQMQVQSKGFTVHYHPDGRPRDYYTDLIIYKGGEKAAEGRIRVNQPMDFDGVRFHQNSFGPTVKLDIHNGTGQVLYSETMVLGQAFGAVPFEVINIPTTDFQAVVALAEGNTTSNVLGGTFIRGGQIPKLAIMGFSGEAFGGNQPDFVLRLQPGQTQTIEDLTVTFEGTQFFSGVVARKDPGAVFIWLAALLFIPAVWTTFWCARRRLWFQVVGDRVMMAGQADRFVDMDNEMAELVSTVGLPEDGAAPDDDVSQPNKTTVMASVSD